MGTEPFAVYRKKKNSYLLRHVCLSVHRPRETAHFPECRLLRRFILRNFITVLLREFRFGLIWDKNIRRFFTCDLALLLGEAPLGESMDNIVYLRSTALSQAKGVYCIGWEWSYCRSCAILFCVCIICTSSREATVVSPLEWSVQRHLNRHDKIVARARALTFVRFLRTAR